MEKNKICPYCGALIADDSYFCDQCGKQLYICPQCHQYGKGKFCKHCGSPMVPANEDEICEDLDPNLESRQIEEAQETPLAGSKDEAIPKESESQDAETSQGGQSVIVKPIKGTTLPKIDIKL